MTDLDLYVERMLCYVLEPDPRKLMELPKADLHAVLLVKMAYSRLMLVLAVLVESGAVPKQIKG